MSFKPPTALLTVAGVALLAACSGSSVPSAPSSPVASGASGATTARALSSTPTPAPSATPTLPPISNGTCPVGHGDVNALASREPSQFLPQVEVAVEQVLKDRPDLFNLDRVTGEGQYFVNDSDQANAEVVLRLQALGLCAYFDFTRQLVQVKSSDSRSEDFRVVSDKSFLRRGEAAYASAWTPASFPLSPAEIIAYVRVGFYTMYCDDGVPLGGNVFAQLPMGCYAIVTATPKMADGTDVDPRIHGPEILWEVEQSGDWIELRDYRDQPFNKYVKGLDPGEFAICATVQGKRGCMPGDVVASR